MTGQHWTSRSEDAFAYAVASNFIAQLETKLDSENLDDKTLALRAKVTPAYISQLFNSPGNIGVKTMAKLTRALNMKFAVVAYVDDGDPNNDSGPIGPEVFRLAWEQCGRPRDLSKSQSLQSNLILLKLPNRSLLQDIELKQRTGELQLLPFIKKIDSQPVRAAKVEDQKNA
jgi:transcriptional regulator with XRE-family HTH domain